MSLPAWVKGPNKRNTYVVYMECLARGILKMTIQWHMDEQMKDGQSKSSISPSQTRGA